MEYYGCGSAFIHHPSQAEKMLPKVFQHQTKVRIYVSLFVDRSRLVRPRAPRITAVA